MTRGASKDQFAQVRSLPGLGLSFLIWSEPVRSEATSGPGVLGPWDLVSALVGGHSGQWGTPRTTARPWLDSLCQGPAAAQLQGLLRGCPGSSRPG